MKVDLGPIVLGALVLPFLAGLGGCYGRSNDAGPAVAVDAQSLYTQMCARCHGPDGRGDAEMKKTIPLIQDFALPAFRAKAPEEVEAIIMTGRNQMPGFGAALTRPKIQHLGGYVRRLGDLAAGAPGTPAADPVAPAAPAAPTPAPAAAPAEAK